MNSAPVSPQFCLVRVRENCLGFHLQVLVAPESQFLNSASSPRGDALTGVQDWRVSIAQCLQFLRVFGVTFRTVLLRILEGAAVEGMCQKRLLEVLKIANYVQFYKHAE